MRTFNGCGTILYGEKPVEGGHISTKWIVFFYIPLLPVRSYIVSYESQESWNKSTYDLVPLPGLGFYWPQVIKTTLIVWSIIAGMAVASWIASQNKAKTQRTTPGEYAIYITSTPYRGISIHPTEIYYTPTIPASNCINWLQVSTSMVGQKICVYGTVYSLYATEQAATRIKFTEKPNTFFLYDSNRVYPDLKQGDCVVAKEILQLFNNTIPYMAVSNLYHCESWMK
jgi:hypothetical protein